MASQKAPSFTSDPKRTSSSNLTKYGTLNTEFEDPEYDSTVHYLSPASLTMTVLNAEDKVQSISTRAFYNYLNHQELDYEDYESQTIADYSIPYTQSSFISETDWRLERTLAIIKPDVVFYEEVIIKKIREEGFSILQKRRVHLTPEQVSELYCQYYGNISFPYLVVTMSSGPIIALCLSCASAVSKWKNLIRDSGSIFYTWFIPKAIRLKYGLSPTLDGVLHASEDVHVAKRELRFFFPEPIIEPLLQEDNAVDYLQLKVNPTLLSALTELCKVKPIEPIVYFAEWLLLNNPYQPKLIPEILKLPT